MNNNIIYSFNRNGRVNYSRDVSSSEMFELCYTVEPRFNEVPRDWGNLVIHFSTVLYIATALETQEQTNKLLKTIVHINFILDGLFDIHCLSLADICLFYRGKFYVFACGLCSL